MASSPFSETSSPATGPPAKDNTLKIVLIVVGGLLLLMMLTCGGVMLAGYFAFQKASETFVEAMSGSFAESYLDNDQAREAIGEVVATDLDFESMTSGEDDENSALEVQVIGTKGKGTLIIGTDADGTESVQLVMDDGRIIELPPPTYDFDEDELEDVDMDDFFDDRERQEKPEAAEDSVEIREPVEN